MKSSLGEGSEVFLCTSWAIQHVFKYLRWFKVKWQVDFFLIYFAKSRVSSKVISELWHVRGQNLLNTQNSFGFTHKRIDNKGNYAFCKQQSWECQRWRRKVVILEEIKNSDDFIKVQNFLRAKQFSWPPNHDYNIAEKTKATEQLISRLENMFHLSHHVMHLYWINGWRDFEYLERTGWPFIRYDWEFIFHTLVL